jgi:squalene synthase HpnD
MSANRAGAAIPASASAGRPGDGLPSEAMARAHVQAVVAASGTSFYWGMRLLPRAKRDAMFAIYAFCREVDDVADGTADIVAKRAGLAAWRAEIDALFAGRPARPTTIALAGPVRDFDLPKAEFDAMIDGMEMDASGRMRGPSFAELWRYCRCVAGAVGMLSIRVFDARNAEIDRGALALGDALQLTNILRDLVEDADLGRLYLPRELLERHGIRDHAPRAVLAHPALPEVCGAIAELAEQRFRDAESCFEHGQRTRLRPALIMMGVYRRTLERLLARGWQRLDQPVRLARPERLWLALRHGLL